MPKESFKAKCQRLNVDYWRALKRREAGMSEEKIFEPGYVRNQRDVGTSIEVNGKTYANLQEAIRQLEPVASRKTIARRMEDGMTPDEAFQVVPNPGYANGIIYLVTNKTTGKKYVGLSVMTLEDRWKYHVEQSKASEITNNDSLQAAIRKYGECDFTLEIVDRGTSKDGLEAKEIEWILHYASMAPRGYNLNKGGVSGGANPIAIEVDGKKFPSHKAATEYIAETREISFEAAKKRLEVGRLDVKSPSKPGEGKCYSKLYKTWSSIKSIYANPRSKGYLFTDMHEAWKNSFDDFAADIGEPPENDFRFVRIDKCKGFFPGNCQWMNKSEAARMAAQYQNKRT